MSNIYFYLLILTMVVNSFYTANCYSKVNRSFLLYGNAIMESSVVIANEEAEEIEVYFDLDAIKEKSKQYFKENIKQYVTSGEIYVTLFESEENRNTCTLNCRGAAIRLHANINFIITFDKQMEFTIKRNIE